MLANITKFENRTIKSFNAKLRDVGLYMEGEIKSSIAGQRSEHVSVDTGRFMSSIQAKSSYLKTTISSNVAYATFLEFGTSRIAPRSHFKNSLRRNRAKIINALKQAIPK